MEKKQIITKITTKIENLLLELEELASQIAQEEEFNSILMEKLNKIEDDTTKIRQGLVG